MNRDMNMEILRDQEKAKAFTAGYLAALSVNGIAAPFTIEHEPHEAQAWVTIQVVTYFEVLEKQMRLGAKAVMNALGAKPEWLAQLRMDVFSDVKLDDDGNPVTDNQGVPQAKAVKTTNQNPTLRQIMEVFKLGDTVLRKLHNDELRDLAKNLLAANDSPDKSPFWNDIDGYVDAEGKELEMLSVSPSADRDAASVVLKRNYLSRVVIPECLRLVANYAGQKVCDTEDVSDAARLTRLLGALPE